MIMLHVLSNILSTYNGRRLRNFCDRTDFVCPRSRRIPITSTEYSFGDISERTFCAFPFCSLSLSLSLFSLSPRAFEAPVSIIVVLRAYYIGFLTLLEKKKASITSLRKSYFRILLMKQSRPTSHSAYSE